MRDLTSVSAFMVRKYVLGEYEDHLLLDFVDEIEDDAFWRQAVNNTVFRGPLLPLVEDIFFLFFAKFIDDFNDAVVAHATRKGRLDDSRVLWLASPVASSRRDWETS